MGVLRRKVKIRAPGGLKPWFHILPEAFRDNPQVVVVSVKRGSTTRIASAADGWRIGLLDTKRGVVGLQIVGAGGGYVDHQEIIEKKYRVPMADFVYAGPLSRLPDKLLLDDKCPLLFLRDRMGQPYLNLKSYIWNVSEGDDGKLN